MTGFWSQVRCSMAKEVRLKTVWWRQKKITNSIRTNNSLQVIFPKLHCLEIDQWVLTVVISKFNFCMWKNLPLPELHLIHAVNEPYCTKRAHFTFSVNYCFLNLKLFKPFLLDVLFLHIYEHVFTITLATDRDPLLSIQVII